MQDKVTAIMCPLSELWVMIENTNTANDDNVPAVKWTWLLEKTVVLSSNFLSDTTGVSTTQLAALLKEKASFL